MSTMENLSVDDWARFLGGGVLPTLSGDKLSQCERVLNLLFGGANLGLGVLDRFRHDPNNAKILAEIQKLVAAVDSNSAQLAQAQLGNIFSALQGLQNEAQSTNAILQSMADYIKSYGKPSVIGQISRIGGLLTEAAAVAEIKRLADNTEKMAGSLQGIDQNLSSINSRGDYFPQHVYSYVKMIIAQHAHDTIPHYIFIFHQGHEWYPKFEEMRRDKPLGPRFIGYKDDLDELCAFLVNEFRPKVGKEPILHILMPTVKPLAITEALTFPDTMRPFHIEGQKGDGGIPYVFMCTPLPEDQRYLKHIGVLPSRPRWVHLRRVGVKLPFISKYTCTAVQQQFFEHRPWGFTHLNGGFLYNSFCHQCDPILPRIAGEARVPRIWEVPPQIAERIIDSVADGYIGLYNTSPLPVIERVI